MTGTETRTMAICLAVVASIFIYIFNFDLLTSRTSTPTNGDDVRTNNTAAQEKQRPSNKDIPGPPSSGKHHSGSDVQSPPAADPEAVLTAHATGDGEAWQAADDDLLVAWAASNPDAAKRWIDDGERSVARAQLLGAVAAGILIRDGIDAMRAFLDVHQADPGMRLKDQGDLDKYLFLHLGREDTFPAALEILRERKDGTLAGYLVLGIDDTRDRIKMIDHLLANDIPVDADYNAFQEVFGREPRLWADWAVGKKADFLGDIIGAWARENPAEAKTWAEETLPAGDPRRPGVDAALTR